MILSIDPGLATCGWAVVRPKTGAVVDLGVLCSSKDADAGKNADRIARATAQAKALHGVATQWECTAVAAEAISLPRKGGIDVYAAIFLSWGIITSISAALGTALVQVAPKQWQRAVVPNSGSSIDYNEVFEALKRYVDQGQCAAKLAAIAPSRRNHPLDAVGVGVYAAIPTAAAITRYKGQVNANDSQD